MQQLFEFIGNHWLLVSALVVVLVALIVTEMRHSRAGSSSLEPSAATLLYNREDGVFLDTRGDADFRKGHLPGALSAPASELNTRLGKLDRFKQRPVIVYCANGLQSGKFAAQLRAAGFSRVYELKGGIAAWRAAGFPVEGK